jgi:hypothetical protein
MKRIIRVATALYHVFYNMRQYPGLFAVLNRSVGMIPEKEAAFIAQAIADKMSPDQVTVVMDIIDRYTAIPDDVVMRTISDQHGPGSSC